MKEIQLHRIELNLLVVFEALMVKVGGRMQPSPFALTLIEDVRPILRSPLDRPADAAPRDRSIGALISEFSGLGHLLANSDFIGTFARVVMAWDMDTYGLRPLPPQVTPTPFRTRFFWSARMANDPASKWIRDIVLETYQEMHDEADRLMECRLAAAVD